MDINFVLGHKSFQMPLNVYPTGSVEEHAQFEEIQKNMIRQFEEIFPDPLAPRTVVILPSLTLDREILQSIRGAIHYEERLLCLLMMLRMPRTKVIYLTSMPVSPVVVDYYLHLLQGITGHHARSRLTMLSCYDMSNRPLSEKVLERPRFLQRVRDLITDPATTHLTCYNITPLEKSVAVQLGIPLFGTDPELFYEGSKSGARKIFRDCGIKLPDGFEDLHTKDDIVDALCTLRTRYPAMRKAVVKMNDGFSGDGNAMYSYPAIADAASMKQTIADTLDQQLKPVASTVSLELFYRKFHDMGGIVEEFLEGEVKMSPSVQCVIGPNGRVEVASTHDQLLGGDDGQVFLGAIFPADPAYGPQLAVEGRKVAKALSSKGALGRFAIDFISVQLSDGSWENYAIEINLRKGGTTHPYLMLQFLSDGQYDADSGKYYTASGNVRMYFASDNVMSEKYKGLTPDDLIDIAMLHGLMYDGAAQEGVMFHIIGALSEFGKIGLVCIGSTHERAKALYDKTLAVLDWECDNRG